MAEFFPSSRMEMAQDGLAPSGDKVVRHPVASRIAALGAAPTDARQYFLLLRFSLVNLVGFALLGAAWMQGWVSLAWTADTTYLSHGIFALFLAGVGVCGYKIWHTSSELNKARRFDPFHNPEQSMALRYVSEVRGRSGDSRALAASSLKLKLTTRIGVVRFIANSLVLLGLIGTVVGFIMALSGVDPETSGDASAITPMVSTLIVGMSVALYTTLIGSVLNVWLMINYHILASGTVNLLTTLVDLGNVMGGLDLFGEDDTGTVFRDIIMLALAGFVAIVILVLPFINPEAKQSEDGDKAPGNVVIEIQWPDGLDADVDLWVQAPGDNPVGYSNKGGDFFNLLRDDLGKISDVTDLNYEIAYSRGIPGGEYTVNVHMYRGGAATFPVPVKVVASVKSSAEESTRQLLTTTVMLHKENEELTAFRFRLDATGNLVRGSVHSLQKPLRTAGAG